MPSACGPCADPRGRRLAAIDLGTNSVRLLVAVSCGAAWRALDVQPGAAPTLVGTAGTVTAVASLDLDLPADDPDRVQGHVLTRAAVERQLARVAALPGLERGRADILIPGIAICLAAMARLGFDSLVVSDRGLREGILCEMVGAT